MSFETNYQEIRRDAAGLMWILSKELKCYDRETIMVNPDIVMQYSNILDWLGGVVCDDWQNIQEIAKELETIKIPETIHGIPSSHPQSIFNHLLKLVSNQAGMEIKQDTSDSELQPLNLEEYTILGRVMSFVEPVKPFFSRTRDVIVESK